MQRFSARVLTVFAVCVVCVLVHPGTGLAQEVKIRPSNASGVYRAGETVRWTVAVNADSPVEARYVLNANGLKEIGSGKLELNSNTAAVEGRLDEPGWLLLEVSARMGTNPPVTALGGAVVDPLNIRPSLPRPEDFDAFWSAKLQELAEIPAAPELTSVGVSKPGVDYYRVTMNNIRGSRIHGQLARPREGSKLPAMLIVQWAGVYGLAREWVIDRAAEGWLVLNISAHDLPISESESFYKEQWEGPLKEYWKIGNDDRETSYFLRMYLSCYRAAQYLAGRPDWDGRTLVVTGGSQGGLQSFVTAALHPRVTAVMALVPAGCDLNGPEAGRAPGWPMWHWNTQGKDETKVRSAARYFDVVNFAPRVKCPVLVGVGLLDTVCPPPGVYAACNLVPGPKEVVPLPFSEHNEKNGSQKAYYERVGAWKAALSKGEAAPVQ